jgi:hypothetical protein
MFRTFLLLNLSEQLQGSCSQKSPLASFVAVASVNFEYQCIPGTFGIKRVKWIPLSVFFSVLSGNTKIKGGRLGSEFSVPSVVKK